MECGLIYASHPQLPDQFSRCRIKNEQALKMINQTALHSSPPVLHLRPSDVTFDTATVSYDEARSKVCDGGICRVVEVICTDRNDPSATRTLLVPVELDEHVQACYALGQTIMPDEPDSGITCLPVVVVGLAVVFLPVLYHFGR